MKIKIDGMESYNIQSLNSIFESVAFIKERIESVKFLCEVTNRMVLQAQEEFTSVNYGRIKSALDSCLEKCKSFEIELVELIKSIVAFNEKIQDIWR